jgi:hypothetical protein
MPSIRLEDLTPFGRVAVKLDQELADLARSGEEIAGVNLETEKGLDEGLKILNRVALCGESVAVTMQDFAASLQEARDKAEAATKLVSERAQIIQRRRLDQDELQARLDALKVEVKEAGAGLSGFAEPVKGEPSEDDKRRIAAELEKVLVPLTRFVSAAQAVKAEAARLNFARIERQADSMIDSLNASRRKIEQALRR